MSLPTVCINALSARRGGGQTYLRHLLPRLASAPLKFILLTEQEFGESLRPILPSNIEVRTRTFPPGYLGACFRVVWENLLLQRFARSCGASILFCPGGTAPLWVSSQLKTVVMSRNMIPFDPKTLSLYTDRVEQIRNFLLRNLMTRSYLRADLMVFISDYAKRTIGEVLNRKGWRGRSLTIPHGVDSPGPVIEAKLPEQPFMLYVSFFHPYKHQMEVVQAYHLLKQSGQLQHKLVIVGEDNTGYAKQVKSLISQLKLDDDIVLTGGLPSKQLSAYYQASELIIFASSCENCPNILLESLSYGKPVACSSVQPMPEFAEDSAVYFDPFQPESIRETVQSLLDQPELRLKLGEKARAQAAQFTWDRSAQSMIEAFQSLLGAS